MASEYYRTADWQTGLRTFGHSVGVVVVAFVLGYLLSGASVLGLRQAGVVTAETVAEGAGAVPPFAYVILFVAQFVGFGIAVYAYLQWRGYPDLFDVGVPGLYDVAATAVGFVALFLAAFTVSALVQLVGAETASNQVIELGQQNPDLFLYLIPVTILFVAPAEELLFRGVVQGLLRRAYGVVPAVLVASAMFGVAHWLALTGGGRVTYVAIAAVLGLVLGTVYEVTENLVVPIVIHGLWNAFLFLSQYVVASGVIDPEAAPAFLLL